MFNNYEALACEKCKGAFMGRKPAEGGKAVCPTCLSLEVTKPLDKNQSLPPEVLAEFEGGRGGDE